MFDLTERTSFENLGYWVSRTDPFSSDRVFRILLGNKSDLPDKRAVFDEEIHVFSREFGLNYFEVSAKTGFGIEECLQKLIERHYSRKVSEKENSDVLKSENNLQRTNIENLNKSCC